MKPFQAETKPVMWWALLTLRLSPDGLTGAETVMSFFFNVFISFICLTYSKAFSANDFSIVYTLLKNLSSVKFPSYTMQIHCQKKMRDYLHHVELLVPAAGFSWFSFVNYLSDFSKSKSFACLHPTDFYLTIWLLASPLYLPLTLHQAETVFETFRLDSAKNTLGGLEVNLAASLEKNAFAGALRFLSSLINSFLYLIGK